MAQRPLMATPLTRSTRLDNRAVAVLVGSETLLGREIRDIATTSAPELDLRLIAADQEKPGTLTRQGDEPAVVEEFGATTVILPGWTASVDEHGSLRLAREAPA